ncbi:GNAT family N-acetyltransferase [Actinoplanes sp. NPDC049668]|uniref:GNAT family N-acetyltransferase n=1 Tax=unclassified Actinoplanes TaxID=2626549 RepID=UPI0033AFCDA7
MIRSAELRDARGIGALKVRAWRAAYGEFMSSDVLDALDPDREADDWAGYLRSMPDGHRLWVAEREGTVEGFCRTGPAVDDADLGDRAAEIYGLYIAPERIGSGLGARLFRHAVLDLRRRGHRPLCLYVYAPNRRARDFYRRAGFEPDGATRLDEADGTGVAELRLVQGRAG